MGLHEPSSAEHRPPGVSQRSKSWRNWRFPGFSLVFYGFLWFSLVFYGFPQVFLTMFLVANIKNSPAEELLNGLMVNP